MQDDESERRVRREKQKIESEGQAVVSVIIIPAGLKFPFEAGFLVGGG